MIKKNYINGSELIPLVFDYEIDLNNLDKKAHEKIKNVFNKIRNAGFKILANIDNYNFFITYIPDVLIIPELKKNSKVSNKYQKYRDFLQNIKNTQYSENYPIKKYTSLDQGIDYCENTLNHASFYDLYNKHSKGYIIYAPRGSGKSDYLNSLPIKNDKSDYVDWCYFYNNLLNLKGIHSNTAPELTTTQLTNIYKNVHRLAKKNNLKLFTSRIQDIKPNAIVLIPWHKHKRNSTNRLDNFNEVDALRLRILAKQYAKKYNIPIFKSFKEANAFCERPSKTKICFCFFILLCIIAVWISQNQAITPKST